MDEDKFIKKIIKLEEDVEEIKKTMATKDDVDKILNGQDKMIQLFTRIDQERLFGNERMKRLETDVKMIKQHLQLA